MIRPPKWADRFLAWYCDPGLLEDLQGDLYEIYADVLDKSKSRADLIYWWLVIRSFRWSALKSPRKLKNSGYIMTQHNLKIAWRVLRRDKLNTAINLLGLTIGITCFLLLGLYAKQEVSYDQFHSNKDRIYRLLLKEDYGDGRTFYNATTPLRFEAMLEDHFPEVERAVQFIQRTQLVGRGEKRINEPVSLISPDFFQVFDFEVLLGNRSAPFSNAGSAWVSRRYAEKYFGGTNAIGQLLPIQINDEIRDFLVEGVFEDFPKSSSIRMEIALSTELCRELYREQSFKAWFNIIPETYVLLKEGERVAAVDNKMQDVVLGQMGDASYGGTKIERDQYNVLLQPLVDIHLNDEVPLGYAPVGNPQYVLILGAIGLLVIIIACINYATLSTGQSLKRSKEVGVRKVMGAYGSNLASQYILEGIIITVLAMAIALALAFLLIPTFNLLTGVDLTVRFQWWYIPFALGFAVVVGALTSIYPALIQSRFKAIEVLRSASQSAGKVKARKGMVILQFVITVFLISTSLMIRKQVDYLQNKDLGISYDALISARLHPSPTAQRITEVTASARANGEILKARLLSHPEIAEVGIASHVFGNNGWMHFGFNDKQDNFKRFRLLIADPQYLAMFGIRMQEGRSFEAGNTFDERQGVLLNPAAVALMEIEDPVGKKLPGDEFGEHQILGVTEAFHFSSLHSDIEPLVIVQNPMPILEGISDLDVNDSYIPKLVFRYNGTNLLEATDLLREEWEASFPNESWNYEFVDEKIRAQYDNEVRMNKLITVATILSIVIAGLGLLGLSLLVVASKVKEIGVRKVLGASPLSIFSVLARSFSIQITVAIILSIPLSLWLINGWLDNFAFRASIDAGIFVLSGLAAILVAGIVIGYHTFRAFKVNPVESLRVE